MYTFSLGVMLDSYRTNVEDAICQAAALGVQGVQLHMAKGATAPENMTADKRRELLNRVKSAGMVISAVCGEQSLGFVHKEKNPELIEKAKRILDMAQDLETNIVTTHIGVIPTDKTCERYKVMQEACFALSRYADSMDAHFAIETGPEIATTLCAFLDDLHSTGVAVNLDPANLVMVTGDDPVQAVYTLKDYIVHTHAKDGKLLRKGDIELLYATAAAEQYHGDYLLETPLGEGDVDFPKYLKALDEIGYHGFLTIERECGDCPDRDIAGAFLYLKDLIAKSAQ